MSSGSGVVVRRSGGSQWRAFEGADVVGTAQALHRPDRRWFVCLDANRLDVFEALLLALDDEVAGDVYATVDANDQTRRDLYERCDFIVHRREHVLRIPTAPAATGLVDVAVPSGLTLSSATEVDLDRLRALDDLLRQDVPGCDGWVNDSEEFRQYTFDPDQFDPATYLVAVDAATGDLAGLVRIWINPTLPRLGLIGVVAAYRRQGLARALLAAAFRPLHDRGHIEVEAEADASNEASLTLLTDLGARRSGTSVELVRLVSQPVAGAEGRPERSGE